MIGQIEIQNFRNILNLDFRPNTFNIISGRHGSGKTSLLEAIALTDSTETEFHTLLKNSYHEPSRKMELDELIHLNFFSHRKDNLESFKVKVSFNTAKSRLLEIWRTDDFMGRSLGMPSSKLSPFIFVFNSPDPKRITPRALQYLKVNSIYKTLSSALEHWPLHFIGPERSNSIMMLSQQFKLLKQQLEFWTTIRSFVQSLEQIEAINIAVHNKIETIVIKLKDREVAVPLYGCQKSIVKMLSILVFLHANKKPYFLIDDIDKDLNDQDLEWLINQVCKIACEKKIQIFASSQRQDIHDLFEKSLGNRAYKIQHLDLTSIWKVEDLNGITA